MWLRRWSARKKFGERPLSRTYADELGFYAKETARQSKIGSCGLARRVVISPQSGRTTVAQQFTAGEKSSARTSSRTLAIPAMNRWAIFNRPLNATQIAAFPAKPGPVFGSDRFLSALICG
jgi:hypothetical protein